MILKISNLIFAFRTYTGVSRAVDDISISLSRGDTLGIVGESGSGKSATALAIMNLLPTPAGRIEEGQIRCTLGSQEINLVQYPRRKMQNFLNLLSELKRRLNLTFIFISHDLAVVKFMSDRIMVMNNGKIEEIGPAEDIYNHPQREYTRKLIAATPLDDLEDIRRQQDRPGGMLVK